MFLTPKLKYIIRILPFFVSGCNITDTDPPTNPFFKATVSGEISGNIEGRVSQYGELSDVDFDHNVFLFEFRPKIFVDGTENDSQEIAAGIALFGMFKNEVEPGGYDIINFTSKERPEEPQGGERLHNILKELKPGELIVRFVFHENDQDKYVDSFYSDLGELNIDNRRDDLIQGNMEFDASGFAVEAPDDTLALQVEIAFDAIKLTYETN